MTKVAIVGLGKWGKVLLSEFNKHIVISYAVTKGHKNKSWLKENFPQIVHSTDLEFVLNSEIDAIVIATPSSMHFQQAKRSLIKGKHVFVEKPPAKSTREAEELLQLAQSNNLALFVDHIFLFDEALQKFKQIVQDSGINELTFKWLKWGTFEEDILWNLLYHDFYLAGSFFGRLISLKIVSAPRNGNKIHARLEFSNGRGAEIFINREFRGEKTKIISARTKDLNIAWRQGSLYVTNRSKEKVFSPETSPLTNSCKEFLKQIRLKNKSYENFLMAKETISALEKYFTKR